MLQNTACIVHSPGPVCSPDYQSTISKACGKPGCPLGAASVMSFFSSLVPQREARVWVLPGSSPQKCQSSPPPLPRLQLRFTREGSIGGIWELLTGSSRGCRKPTEAGGLDSNHTPLAQKSELPGQELEVSETPHCHPFSLMKCSVVPQHIKEKKDQ